MRRFGFTMLELVFVITIMGILSKFGVELLAQAYKSFIFSSVNNALQSKGEMAVEAIGSRLQYRVKNSIIARNPDVVNPNLSFQSLASSTFEDNATVLEWVGTDIENFRGNSNLPNWSGIIDLDNSSATTLDSRETNTTGISNTISILSHASGTDINDSAIYFVGSLTNINNYAWNGVALTDHNTSAMHRVTFAQNGNDAQIISTIGGVDFSGTDIYEYYQLAWSAYAVEHNTTTDELRLYYDYQPWSGESYTDGQSELLMENVSTFRFKAVGSVVKIQVCVTTDLVEDYSLCKEKTIY